MKERKEKTPRNSFYCKVCRMWYPDYDLDSKKDHLSAHLDFVQALINDIDTSVALEENKVEDLQTI